MTDSINPSPTASSPVGLPYCLLGGLVGGLAAAFFACLTHVVCEKILGWNHEELTATKVATASIVASFAGAFVYYACGRWAKRPLTWFIAIGLVVATLDSIIVAFGDYPKGFALHANVLHYVVAAAALYSIPKAAGFHRLA